MGKTNFKRKNYHSKEVLELVNIDLCGPIGTQSYTREKNFIIFVNDYSRIMTVMYLKDKSEAFQKFKWYLSRVEKETRKKLKCLRLDRGREFNSNELNELYNERQASAPSTHQKNDIAERRNRSIMDCARTLMIENNVAIN